LRQAAAFRYCLSVQNNVAISAMSALASDTRLRAFQLLVTTGADGLPAGEIARRLDVPQNTLSDHLQVLARAGIIVGQRNSRSIVYRVNITTISELATFLLSTIGPKPADLKPHD
jgi:DNA-binding transcriptional ArsR family regulator